MPKCTNDSNKSYTGKEPSPKGFGFCASAEDLGKVMVGKDGSNWIVKQTKTCKKWVKTESIPKLKPQPSPLIDSIPLLNPESTLLLNSESTPLLETESIHEKKYKNETIDFDNLEEDCYTYSYLPDVSETTIINETGLEEKFGGSKPFFIEGETWPLCDIFGDEHGMEFVAQFKDPRNKNNILYRVFWNFYECNISEVCDPIITILPIELNEENLKKQIFLLNPSPFEPITKANEIKSWKPCKELKQLSYILDKYRIESRFPRYFSMYNSSKYAPYSEVKIGGTPVYYRSVNHKRYSHNFLQLSGCDYLPISWENYGIGHVEIDGDFDYDAWATFF
jgi:hypothetical protein